MSIAILSYSSKEQEVNSRDQNCQCKKHPIPRRDDSPLTPPLPDPYKHQGQINNRIEVIKSYDNISKDMHDYMSKKKK